MGALYVSLESSLLPLLPLAGFCCNVFHIPTPFPWLIPCPQTLPLLFLIQVTVTHGPLVFGALHTELSLLFVVLLFSKVLLFQVTKSCHSLNYFPT